MAAQPTLNPSDLAHLSLDDQMAVINMFKEGEITVAEAIEKVCRHQVVWLMCVTGMLSYEVVWVLSCDGFYFVHVWGVMSEEKPEMQRQHNDN
jgi:hypothetical protein